MDIRLDELRRQIQIGRDQIDRGDYIGFDATGLNEFFDVLQENGRRRCDERRQQS
jgi:hypothetical protein